MPKHVSFVECGVKGCKGHLGEIARTIASCGPQYGDAQESTFFLKCGTCGLIFVVDGGEEAYDASDIAVYEGKLTEEEIRKYVPEHTRHFCEWHEGDVIAKARPKDWKGRAVVSLRDGCGIVGGLPASFVGKTVEVRLVE